MTVHIPQETKLTIFGATGRVGRHVLEQAVAAGHDVTAVVRNPGKLTTPVQTVVMDMRAPEPVALKSALDGADAVLSCLGPQGRAEHGIVSTGTRAVVEAMEAAGGRRLVVISGVGVSTRTAYGRNLRGAFRISRADAAHLMLALVGRPEAVRQTVTVAY
ncbi:NAD(P)-dependent oxidoreductase [Nonomuraea roseola]|uniref:NAD(P)-dependent oxidoreductase n=1 Tax=Nonomuraea roseola TaxID=46179 RepID=A0ABV5PUV7_9ACTN